MAIWALVTAALMALVVPQCSGQDDLYYETPPVRPTYQTEEEGKICEDKAIMEGLFEPVCPPGYFRCCATCKDSACYGSEKLMLSWRGIPECLLCEPGDFCDGCDNFKLCPANDLPGREGPRVSRAGSSQIVECESCPMGYEASYSRDACAPKYTDVCYEKTMQRCLRGCRSSTPSNGKMLDACEFMQCSMYCAKAHSEACAEKYGEHCRYMTQDTGTDGLGAVMDTARIANCPVDCSGAPSSHQAGALVAAAAAASVLWSLLV
jgi:hypothetical protein